MEKVFITGCAKTGTTLVRRLFNAFDLKVYNYDEINLYDFLHSPHEVGKRTRRTVFSYDLTEEQVQNELLNIAANGVKIVNVTRKRKDVTKGGRISNHRYNACIKQAEQYGQLIDFTIEYEKLIKNPDKVQKELAEKLGLKIIHKWSQYPSFIDINQERKATHSGNYSLRKIGEKPSLTERIHSYLFK